MPRPSHPTVAMAGMAGMACVVAAGGMVGVLGRAGIEHALPSPPGGWPWTTFWINLAGSLALGALLETLARWGPDRGWRRVVRLGCGTGVLGGFTTYSTFAVQAVRLADGGAAGAALTYTLVSVATGVAAAAAGIVLASRAHRRWSARRDGAAT